METIWVVVKYEYEDWYLLDAYRSEEAAKKEVARLERNAKRKDDRFDRFAYLAEEVCLNAS